MFVANWKGPTATLGSDILLDGFAIQAVTVAFFVAICQKFSGRSLLAVRSKDQERHFNGLQSISVSSVFLEVSRISHVNFSLSSGRLTEAWIRCIFRLIEHATGYDGYLFTHEWNSFVFEALPMIAAIAVFALSYPPR